ncbi:uncharacterized protein AMSG_03648 [Thecamonas trahens ATCC 50062]|uniref:Autophagy-related protein 27 n=1 Tax=Thecamonas trahens ATCC 50062 TaxID=461836 RepID=A0A0L0D4Q3_THETB|nr:hypothetical protein AMSG_03648 [Thecamonas trahens ATCC 50062]KNC47220.1 hypothetical protein AMSG_03648 [Thecamonas trahens ATCC 50062]|eukprot:XP_013759989.1 hypothetical protein AMSG_03648 [Thecamonas trahens ATCC 50062]
MKFIGVALVVAVLVATAFADNCPSGFSNLGNNGDFSVVDGTFTYKVSPCGSLSSTKCTDSGVAVCQEWSSGMKTLGLSSARTVVTSGSTVTITLGDGAHSNTCNADNQAQLVIACDESVADADVKLTFVSSDNCVYKFTAKAKAACGASTGGSSGGSSPAKKKGGLSLGSIILIIMLCLTIVYIGAGMAYNFQMKGLRGVEMFPNLGFWKSFPGLVKDGVLFTYAKITRKDSYSSIP